MGVLTFLRTRACGRRRPATAGDVCPISGQTSDTGVCPMSGKAASNMKKPTPEQAALKLKDKGNLHFKKNDLEGALTAYTEALNIYPRDPAVWLNRSIVNRQTKKWYHSKLDAACALELQPSNVKAHYSKAFALQQLGELEEAIETCDAGLTHQPDHKALLELRTSLEKATQACAGSQTEAQQEAPKVPVQQDEVQESTEESSAVVSTTASTAGSTEDDCQCPSAKLGSSSLKEIKEKSQKTVYEWKERNPSNFERSTYKEMMVDAFREKYIELRTNAERRKKNKSILQTDQYEKEQKLNLSIQGGHQPMDRPEDIELPETYQQPLGVISAEELGTYNHENPERRYLLSVYGKIFDVSDRPDKYGPNGPYNSLTGKDITWGLFTGIDTEEMCNRFYDLFKAKDMGKDKMAGICSWLAWYETEYGKPVGDVEPYTHERNLPMPPLEEVEDACTMM